MPYCPKCKECGEIKEVCECDGFDDLDLDIDLGI